jgi:hypothetical protein
MVKHCIAAKGPWVHSWHHKKDEYKLKIKTTSHAFANTTSLAGTLPTLLQCTSVKTNPERNRESKFTQQVNGRVGIIF